MYRWMDYGSNSSDIIYGVRVWGESKGEKRDGMLYLGMRSREGSKNRGWEKTSLTLPTYTSNSKQNQTHAADHPK